MNGNGAEDRTRVVTIEVGNVKNNVDEDHHNSWNGLERLYSSGTELFMSGFGNKLTGTSL